MEWNQHAVVQILPHLGQVWVYASHKPERLTTSMMVSIRNAPTLGTKRYPLPLIAFRFFLVSTKNNRSVVLFFVIFRGSFGHFYALSEFSMQLCAEFKLELLAHAPVHINWCKNKIFCPWVHA